MSFYLDRPLNFAHRGASHEAPANTLAAFLLAVDLDADGIELDVHLSRDGHLVVIHDFDVSATTDGHGLVRAKTLAELKELDAGSWFDPVFAGQRIPTLQEVIDAVGHRLLLNIELKVKGWGDGGLAEKVVRIVEQNGLVDRVILSSFNPLAVWRVRRRSPQIATGLLYAQDMPLFLRKAWLRGLVRPAALHPHHAMVDAHYVWWADKQGYRVNVWTADDPGDMWRLVRQGVDIIITNRPDLLRQVIQAGQGAVDQSKQRLPATL
ncbi:MAG: glycerophosphodiester phosphodiesterase [Anaerolineae bacterium]|nr:glycerophosphodiester phosphodiesterase [Anaerolineae bacterium]